MTGAAAIDALARGAAFGRQVVEAGRLDLQGGGGLDGETPRASATGGGRWPR